MVPMRRAEHWRHSNGPCASTPGTQARTPVSRDAYFVLGQFGVISEPEARQSALAAARAAVELGDDSAEAHRALADLSFFFDWDWGTAEREVSEDARPESQLLESTNDLRGALRGIRRFPEALKQAEIARSLDPQSAEVKTASAVILLYAGKPAQAKAQIERRCWISLSPPAL